jgi:hypothetical protein
LPSGIWWIRDRPDGWRLRVYPVLSFADRYPRGVRRRILAVLLLVGLLLGLVVGLGLGPAAQMDPVQRLLIVSGDVVACAVATWLLQNPQGRFRTSPEHGYFALARGMQVRTLNGTFELGCLRHTAVDPSLGFPGRVGLAFTAEAGFKVELVGWPGLDPADAEVVRQLVLERVGGLREG